MGSFLPWNLAMNLNPELRLEHTPAYTSYRPTKPGHTTASLDAMSLHSICHSAYCALVSQDVFGELSVEINQNHEEKVASKDFLCFLFGFPNGAINPRNHETISEASLRWRRNRRIWGSSSGVARPMKCTHSYTPPEKLT